MTHHDYSLRFENKSVRTNDQDSQYAYVPRTIFRVDRFTRTLMIRATNDIRIKIHASTNDMRTKNAFVSFAERQGCECISDTH